MKTFVNKIIETLDLDVERGVKIDAFLNTVSYYKLAPYLACIKNNPKIVSKIPECKDSWDAVVLLYRYNIKLSKAVYPCIYLLETTLKTKINNLLCKTFGNDWYKDDAVLHKADARTVSYLLKKKDEYLRDSATPSLMDFVENHTTLGYWVSIVDSLYFWNSDEIKSKSSDSTKIQIRNIFSNNDKISPTLIKRKEIVKSLRSIKDLRNAISHYNQIIGCKITKKDTSNNTLFDIFLNILEMFEYMGCNDIDWMIGDLDCCEDGSFLSLYKEFEFIHEYEIKADKAKTVIDK